MSVGLRDELYVLKGKLEQLEKELTDQMMELEIQADKWAKYDEEADNLISSKTKNPTISLDVGGKKFQTKLETLLSIKDTLFYRLILSNKIDYSNEIFIDRDPEYFDSVLSFLRNKKLNLNIFKDKQLKQLKLESDFYGLTDLESNVDEALSQVYFLSFQASGTFVSGTTTAGTQKVEHLNDFEDKSLKNGICTSYNGWIMFELNREVEFDSLLIAGWGGNPTIWSPSNGASSRILTSLDNKTYVDVGNTGSNYSSISEIKVTKSRAKYIKLQSTSYLGLGYLKINKCD